MAFKHVYQMQPIDLWDKAEFVDGFTAEEVLAQMPEEPRDGLVFKLIVPDPPQLAEIYLCKANNNGTIYIFTDADLIYNANDFIYWNKD